MNKKQLIVAWVRWEMRKILMSLFFVVLSFQLTLADVDSYAYPTEFEFDVYQYYMGAIDTLINVYKGETPEAEQKIKEMTAETFKISPKDVDNIYIKIYCIELEIFETKKIANYQDGDIASYQWSRVKELIDEFGWDKIIKRNE